MRPGIAVFRADATQAIGHGHLMRCLALAQAWQDLRGKSIFVSSDLAAELSARLQSDGFEVLPLNRTPGSREDALDSAAYATDRAADWIVIDGYHFTPDYEHTLKSCGCKVLRIDDWGQAGRCRADIVLDQNAGTSEQLYRNRASHTQLLLGSRYVMLRREFIHWRQWKREIPPIARNVLVAMGGSDSENLTTRILEALRLADVAEMTVTVVLGTGNSHARSVELIAAKIGEGVRVLTQVSNMPELIASADMAIIAGGGTLWECLYMGCPVLSLARNHLQEKILSRLSMEDIIHFAGRADRLSQEDIASLALDLAFSLPKRKQMIAQGRLKVDGDGAKRVCEAMIHANSTTTEATNDTRVVARSQ